MKSWSPGQFAQGTPTQKRFKEKKMTASWKEEECSNKCPNLFALLQWSVIKNGSQILKGIHSAIFLYNVGRWVNK